MGLFDNLFKPRPEDAIERIIEAPLRAIGRVEKGPTAPSEDDPDPESAFLQPKGYAEATGSTAIGGQNQGFVPVLPSPRRTPPSTRKAAAADGPAVVEKGEVTLCVGDVLPRIPVGLLRPGPHDLKRPLRFRVEHLSSDIARGKPGIALSIIAEQCPHLFHGPISDDDDMEIRLPLQKIVEQVSRIRAHLPAGTPPVAPSPSPSAPPPSPELPPTAVAPVAEPAKPAPAPEPPRVAPVVAEPPRDVVPEPPISAPSAPPAPETPPPPAAPESRAPESPAPSVEPPVSIAPPPVIEPIAPPPVEVAPEPIVEPLPPVSPPPPAPPPAPPPTPAPPPPASETMIDLSLAALVAAVPPEMLLADRPLIEESCRVQMAFSIVERQLGTGRVVISAAMFTELLPALLRPHFVLRAEHLIPIPLEEIFQNLPVAGPSPKSPVAPFLDTPSAQEPEPPVILAPPAPDEASVELPFDRPWEQAAAARAAAELSAHSASTVEEPPSPAEVPLPESFIVAAESAPPPVVELPAATHDEDVPPLAAFHRPAFHPAPQIPQTLAPAVAATAGTSDSVILGEAPLSGPDANVGQVLKPAESGAPISGGGPAAPHEQSMSLAPAASAPEISSPPLAPVPDEPPSPTAHPELLAAFAPEEPPPVHISQPEAAVAILRGTVPVAEESAVFATASVNVQPPQIYRPMVQAPPVSGQMPSGPIHLAPTLGGPPPAGSAFISLAPSPGGEIVETRASAPPTILGPSVPAPAPAVPSIFLQPAPPAANAPAPTPLPPEPAPTAAAAPLSAEPPAPVAESPKPSLREAARRLFEPPASEAPESTAAPASPAPPAAELRPPSLPATTPAPSSSTELHLHIPPLPSAVPPPAPVHEPVVPALPLSRFDQHSLQSLFMTDEVLDLPKVTRLAAALPGIEACVISTRGETLSGGTLPPGFDIATLRGLAPQVGAAADRLPIGALKNFTLYGEQFSVSFFERESVCLCAIHRARAFIPGVREKLAAVVEELGRNGRW